MISTARLLSLVIVSLVFVARPAAAFNADDFLFDIKETRLLAAGGKQDAAIAYWERLWPLYGDSNGRYEYELAMLYSKADRSDQSERAYLDAIDLKPDSPRPYIGLSFLYLEQKRYTEARRWARRTVYEYPELALGYTTLGHIYWKEKRFANARTWLAKSLEVNARPEAYWLFAIVSYELKDWLSVVDSMEAAIRLDRKYLSEETGMRIAAVSLARLGRYREAYRTVEILRDNNPAVKTGEIELLLDRVKDLAHRSSVE